MIDTLDPIHPQDIVQVTTASKHAIPFFLALVQGGFPSPAENYVERVCSLDDLCIVHPEATYFVRVAGESMIGDRICPGDVLIVDSALKPADGSVVVVWLNGEYCVKRFVRKEAMVLLESSNEKYAPIYVHPDQDEFTVLGVVTFVIFKPAKYVRPR
ncbi:translesion error-prone DNA polymerase V autoproteolytic subunit [Spirosoma migulaei]